MQFTPPEGEIGPLVFYQNACSSGACIQDAEQLTAISALDVLWHQLVEFKHKRNQFLGRSWLSPDVPHGLYCWGGVGRGKTFLMDVFYACVPYRRKRRVHFHRFMSEVHHQMKHFSDNSDPLLAVAEDIAKHTRLLCLDEFHVDDIADAMILARLLAALFERGVVLVTTSNYAPDDLYPNGLQRQNFLPAIELLKRQLTVVNLDGEQDYRLRGLKDTPLFMVAEDSQQRMAGLFEQMAAGEIHLRSTEIAGRKIRAEKMARNIVWFSFSEICGGDYAQEDYLLIAKHFSTVFLSDIPKLGVEQAAQARRLTWLVDVLYDHGVRLIASSVVTPENIYTEGLTVGEFARTVSRLIEMQTKHG